MIENTVISIKILFANIGHKNGLKGVDSPLECGVLFQHLTFKNPLITHAKNTKPSVIFVR